MAKGKKTGGRKPGTPNKGNQTAQEVLARLGHCPYEGMALIAMNEVPCGECRGTGRKRYKLPDALQNRPCPCIKDAKPNPQCRDCSGLGVKLSSERECQSCWGDLYEACSPELRGKMDAELGQYVGSKRKAVEVSGSLEIEVGRMFERLARGRERLEKT